MKKHKLASLIIISLLFAVAVIGCGQSTQSEHTEQPKPIDIQENGQDQVAEDRDLPQRIVSIVPGMTEVLFDLGLEDRIVGVTLNCDYPVVAASKAIVGDWIINMESLLALEPDLVVGMPSANFQTLDEIEALGINVLAVEAQSIEGIYEIYREVGIVTGTEAMAEEIIENMQNQIATVEEKIATINDEDRLRVFLEIGYEPLYSASVGSLQHELLIIAGGVNAVTVESPWVEYSMESVLADNPDAIIITHPASTAADVAKRSGYSQVTAVVEDRVTDNIDPNILVRPTQRAAQGIEEIAEFLYPQLFN
ncbi:ABC transporter substrate-binding protein [Desulfuribacillus alkaliarsenatis]|uniref:Fe/B12 periplasmic-binding domain-containing protein n=1 Tax=Desulfuribacillus alkaliarsenatis TaxID=766136 RepID=A0A1E5G4M3_9FIRM|nr:ABC transporter substrate-binding protein [Desulfuribacillus alkaliarsenatis]OEF97984.1 hypothetical protein BHF68_13020 [Desulfuribacillus alkaliarsenatis]